MALCEYNCNTAPCGINTSCVSQIPASNVVIQPAPFSVTIPGPIISASCEQVAVAQNTPCATGYGGYYGGYGSGSCYGGYGSGSCYGGYGSGSCYGGYGSGSCYGGYGSGYGYGCGYGKRYRYGCSSSPCYYPGYTRRGSYSSCGPC